MLAEIEIETGKQKVMTIDDQWLLLCAFLLLLTVLAGLVHNFYGDD
jgi:hypothetical protein